MAKQTVGLGSSANDGTGDTLRSGGTKLNANFDEIYAEFGDGTTLASGNTSGDILVADGTKFSNVTTSGDINISNTGAINLRTQSATNGQELSIAAGSAPSSTSSKLYNVGGTLYWNGNTVGVSGGGNMSSFTLAGQAGSGQSITDGQTLTVAGGTGITTTTASGTDTVTVNAEVSLAGTQTFTNKTLTTPTLTTPVINTSVSGSGFLDDDTFGTASATTLASSESIKAYVDAQVATENTIDEMNDTTISTAADGHFLVHTGSAWVNEAPATARTSLGLGTIATVAAPSGTVVGTSDTQTLSAKTLTEPKIADAGFIADANGAEQIIFQTTASAVNEIEVTNSATGGSAIVGTSTAPIIGASGETNVDLALLPKGTGYVTVRSTTGANNQGAIRLNCENNTHGQTIMSQPHSASDSSYFMLPKGSSTGNARATPDVLLSADKTVATTETATGAGSAVALSLDTLHTAIVTSGAQAFTLANGVNGQIKTISLVTDGGNATLTPATLNGGTTIVFVDAGDGVTLVYNTTGGWSAVANNGTTIS